MGESHEKDVAGLEIRATIIVVSRENRNEGSRGGMGKSLHPENSFRWREGFGVWITELGELR